MVVSSTCHFLVLLSLLVVLFLGVEGKIPEACQRYECPSYTVTETGNDYEIRSYDSPVWISTSPINDTSAIRATETGFHRLFLYVSGNNTFKKAIKMTSPVTSEVSNSGGSSSIIQVAALKASLAGTKWSSTPKSYIVGQYNAPFELYNRVNEIGFLYP
ncbi:hypothetical protein VNO78_06631 [Psophocarpus tetragonolobus]|uniref:Uncharacterized protein n=1 Tax=Psophocarpus tetragonolobus TaxID=3891 RepID=A0AAN9T1V5_PSOTE